MERAELIRSCCSQSGEKSFHLFAEPPIVCDVPSDIELVTRQVDQGLEALDRRLLWLLQADASLSHAALAERVGASPASVWRRIRALEQVKYTTAAPV